MLVGALLLPGSTASGQESDLASTLLAALNSVEASPLEAFVATRLDPGLDPLTRGAIEHYLHSIHGYLTPLVSHGEVASDGDWTRTLVRSEVMESWHYVRVLTHDGQLAGFGLDPAGAPDGHPDGRHLGGVALRDELDAHFRRLEALDVFHGSVLVVQEGRQILLGSFGLSSRRFGVTNRVETRFAIGSMGKMFTAVAILQLIESGDLRLSTPVDQVLDSAWFGEPDRVGSVTIEHLLTHTSGLGSFWSEEYDRTSRAMIGSVDSHKPFVQDLPLEFEPGTRWQYSNAGYILLGAVIESVTGVPYDDYVQLNIFDPAGMASTGFFHTSAPVPDLAVGYTATESEWGWRNNWLTRPGKGSAAGGGYSTVGDLARFEAALRSGVLLSPETFAAMVSPKPDVASPRYGYGFDLGSLGIESGHAGHAGGFEGVNSEMRFAIDGSFLIVVLANVDNVAANAVAKIYRHMADRAGCC